MVTVVRTSNFTVIRVPLCQMSNMVKQYWCLDYAADLSHTISESQYSESEGAPTSLHR